MNLHPPAISDDEFKDALDVMCHAFQRVDCKIIVTSNDNKQRKSRPPFKADQFDENKNKWTLCNRPESSDKDGNVVPAGPKCE